ncbi:aminopeptidase N-like [Photinus pyralis]|nr:aminopeptidase N-like [Photinus pyralis]
MTVTVEESYKIPFLFDKTAYQKSGAVIRMLENMVSRKVFRQGLIYYLKEKQFQTVTPRDLYRNIQRVLDESSENVFPQPLTVESVMTTWETIAGFPLVTVTRNYGSTINNINLKQRAFNIYNNQGEDGRWTIPINYASKGSASFESTAPKKWLIHPTDTFTVADLDDRDWFIVNVQQSGYYRVNYDERNWALIADALKEDHRVIHPLNRAKLLEDSFYLGATGDISPNIFSKLSEYLVNEDDSLVLAALPALFASMDNKLYYSRGHDDFKDRVIYLLQGAYNHLTFDERLSDRLSEKEARAGVIFWLCKMGHMECRSKALEKFEAWKNENATISTDLESAVFCSAMRSNNQSHFDYLFKLFIETTDYDLKSRIASGLSCMEEHKYLQRFLENCLNYCPSALLEQVIKQMHSSSKHGLEVVLDFLSQNMEKVHKIFGGHTKFMVEELASQSYTDGHLRKLARSQLWAKSVPFFDRAVATIANNVAWLNKNEHKLLEFLTHSQ